MESQPKPFPGSQIHAPAPLPPQPRQRPGEKPAQQLPPGIAMPPQAAPNPARLLRFTCPACFAYLEVDPQAPYHGQPAPCPMCQTIILPPMIFPVGANFATAQPKPPVRIKPGRENMAVEFKRRRRES